MHDKKSCFVIGPIGDPGSPMRAWADAILDHVIIPALGDQYDPIRSDRLPEPGMITVQIVDRVLNSDLVIADLTAANPNVYYELAIRHAVKKPTIHLIKKGELRPFDIYGVRSIGIDNDLKSGAEAIEEIRRQVAVLEKDPKSFTTPISVSIDVLTIGKSDTPMKELLGVFVASLFSIYEKLREIEYRIGIMPEHPLVEVTQAFLSAAHDSIRDKGFSVEQVAKLEKLIPELEKNVCDFKADEEEKKQIEKDLHIMAQFMELVRRRKGFLPKIGPSQSVTQNAIDKPEK